MFLGSRRVVDGAMRHLPREAAGKLQRRTLQLFLSKQNYSGNLPFFQ